MLNRSLLRGFAAATLSLALFASACGGDDDGDSGDANGANGDSNGDATTAAESTSAAANTPQSSETLASPSRPAATAVPSDGAALVVASLAAQVQFIPTADEFRAMEKTTVAGQDGVSLPTLMANAEISEATVATIEGTVPANGNFGSIRYPVADFGSSTIFVMDDRGHITIVSDTIPEAERLTNVTSIVLQ